MNYLYALLAVSLYFFIYTAVMIDAFARHDEIEADTVANRKSYSVITMLITMAAFAAAAYGLYQQRNLGFKMYNVVL